MTDRPTSIEEDGIARPCEQVLDCRNSDEWRGPRYGDCRFCRFAKANGGEQNCYKPMSSMVAKIHPIERAEKRQRAIDRQQGKIAARKAKNSQKRKLAKQAARAEAGTNREIIRATVNSGRSHQDLDHISRDRILLDSKNQSQRVHPLVDLTELDKARRQAVAAGYPVGGLVLINQHGRRVVVFDIEDYAKVIR